MTLITSADPADYALSPANGEVVFPIGTAVTTTMTATISTIEDTLLEGDETFTVEIDGTTPTATIGTSNAITLTIQNDDGEFLTSGMHAPSPLEIGLLGTIIHFTNNWVSCVKT